MDQNEDKQLLDVLEEMIRKKREEIAGLNNLIGSMQHPTEGENGTSDVNTTEPDSEK